MEVGNEMEITLTNTILASGMEKVTAASGDYLYFHLLTIVFNIFIRSGTYSLMFIVWVYNK